MKSLRSSLALVPALLVAAAAPALAQPPPAAPPPAAPQPVAAPVVPPAAPDPIVAALAPRPGGLKIEDMAKTVSKNKYSVRAKQEDLKAAAARVDQAMVNFFPRVSATATFTKLSPVNAPNLGNILAFIDPNDPLQKNGAPTVNMGAQPSIGPCGTSTCITAPGVDGKGNKATLVAVGAPLGFESIPHSYNLTATIALPVSDYVLRIAQGYAAASHGEKAARMAAEAEGYQAAADARIAYYNWVRAKGAVVVAKEAIDQARAHVEDAKKAFAVGLASKADVLRIEAQLAAAQQGHAESIAFAQVAEEQVRTLIQTPSDRVLEIGSDVFNAPVDAPADSLGVLQDQALSKRLEIRALDETIYSLQNVERVQRAGYFPRVDAFFDATYANPNQRIFPTADQWNATWDVGVRLSWTINDTFTAIGAVAEAKAKKQSVVEQKGSLRDGLRLEVASAYADAAKGPPTVEAAERGLAAAEESLRVRRELFRNGKATSSELVDAEAELTRARLSRLNARVGVMVAKARLDHATGRDVPAKPVD
jgi:outer membrane protein TolC